MRLIDLLGPDTDFDPRGRAWATARSMLGAASLSSLMFTPSRLLFLRLSTMPANSQCSGLARSTLWCLGGSPQEDTVAKVIAVLVLVGVILGLWPRWLCIPHWYVAFSINSDITIADGGAKVAAIATLLLILPCLGDRRANHWLKSDRPLEPGWSGAAHAAMLLLRVQLAIVYLVAAASKLRYPAWRNGKALPVLSGDPQFGLPQVLRPLAQHLLSVSWLGDLITWSVPAVELAIALALVAPRRVRTYGLALVILLHSAIILAMGLFSFGAIMIATALAATSAGNRLDEPYDGDRPLADGIFGPPQQVRARMGSELHGE